MPATCLNLASLLDHQARLTPDRLAIVLRPYTLTYAQLDAMACRVAERWAPDPAHCAHLLVRHLGNV